MPRPVPSPEPARVDAWAPDPATLEWTNERLRGYRGLLRYGGLVAVVVMLLDAVAFLRLDSTVHLVFSALAAGCVLVVAYAVWVLRGDRLDRAVFVPLFYLLLIAPVGPALLETRVLVSVALPVIVMAVAMNFASVRFVPHYAVGSWAATVAVLGFWQWHMVERAGVAPTMGVVTVVTAAVILAFAFYALSRYSDRLENAFQREKAANTELQGMNRSQVAFMNNAAHELNTPLTPIRIQMALLKRSVAGVSDPHMVKSVDILDRNFHRLNDLVGDILDGTRLRAGKLRIRKVQVDLSDLVEEAVEEYERPAEVSGLRIASRIEPGLVVPGDPLRLRQVLDNLLSNAFKFTPPGGSIRVDAMQTEGNVCVVVSDTGNGIAPQALGELFQPFHQLHDPETRTQGGTGLGLYIARGIVRRHGGEIWADSAGLGKGCAFSFTVPIASDEAVSVGVSEVAPIPSGPLQPSR